MSQDFENEKETMDNHNPADQNTEATNEPNDQANDQSAQDNQANTATDTQPELRIVEENIDYKDKYIRLSAEFDNYRKRTMKEKVEYIKNASSDMLQKLIPVKDNFERALRSMETASDVQALKEGVELIYKTFSETLRISGLKEIDALHQNFDVDLHEALTKIPAPSPELAGKVVDVIEKGYTLNDKVIRYAKVVIGE